MTVQQKQSLLRLSSFLMLGVLVLVGATVYRRALSAPSEVRITLVAKGMSFVSTESPEIANPTLTVPAGRRITIEVRNDDPGTVHDLVLQGIGVQTPSLKPGESAVLHVTVPDSGRVTYYCTFHPLMMRGDLVCRNTAP